MQIKDKSDFYEKWIRDIRKKQAEAMQDPTVKAVRQVNDSLRNFAASLVPAWNRIIGTCLGGFFPVLDSKIARHSHATKSESEKSE